MGEGAVMYPAGNSMGSGEDCRVMWLKSGEIAADAVDVMPPWWHGVNPKGCQRLERKEHSHE
jgi:hypothetical protein